MVNKIVITRQIDARTGKTCFRAVAHIPHALIPAPGLEGRSKVYGASTPDGPWTEGYGRSPKKALAALCRAIGEAVVRAVSPASEA